MKNRKLRHVRAALKIVLVGVICIGGLFAVREIYVDDPGKLLVEYMDHVEKQEYSQMYAMLDHEKSNISTEEDFTERNSRIYEGIEVSDISVQNTKVKKKWNGEAVL
ncbi:NTF2-like N-terminal transpeptidase domain-containing protein [Blautia sp. HCP3S3_D9]|uniref:NTF2-like N-terminal transpeptidase domain-containing protein n=1 Tax=Blautia sp. HCP3S3_D9 TaxID=3438912 RepID=UPI003F89FF59